MNVIIGNLSTFTVFQDHIFWPRSYQGQISIAQCVYCDVSYVCQYESDKHNGYWNITEKVKFWHFVAGCEVCENIGDAKKQYSYAYRRLRRQEQYARNEKMAEAIASDRNRDMLKVVKKMNGYVQKWTP